MVRVEAQFRVGNLALWPDSLQFNEVSFHKPRNYEELIRAVEQEHKDTDTATAIVALDLDPIPDPNTLLEEAKKRLQPYLSLLSLAQGSWVRWSSVSAFEEGKEVSIAFETLSLPYTRPHPSELIRLNDQEAFIRQTHRVISQPDFSDRTRFHIALMWYLQASEQDWEETNFLLLYIALEALAWAHIELVFAANAKKLRYFGRAPKAKIEEFFKSMKAPVGTFFPDPDQDLHELRNHIAHRGMAFQRSTPGPFGKQILALQGLLDSLFLSMLQYQGPYRDITHRGQDRDFPSMQVR